VRHYQVVSSDSLATVKKVQCKSKERVATEMGGESWKEQKREVRLAGRSYAKLPTYNSGNWSAATIPPENVHFSTQILQLSILLL
jgi:hypothetical protein